MIAKIAVLLFASFAVAMVCCKNLDLCTYVLHNLATFLRARFTTIILYKRILHRNLPVNALGGV